MLAGFPDSLDSVFSARALGRTGILRSFVQWPTPQTHTHSPTHLGERYHVLKGANQDSRSVMSHQGSPVWKILPYQQHQKLQSIHVLPHKPLWDRHNGKWEGQPRKPLWRLTPTTGGERLHYSLSGSGILSSHLLNWVWLPGKVILPKANWHVHVTPHLGWQ